MNRMTEVLLFLAVAWAVAGGLALVVRRIGCFPLVALTISVLVVAALIVK